MANSLLDTCALGTHRCALRWAAFLGISWTWCIGMFLPVLLVRDYGLVAWWVFAIPNVVGAAAMGFVLRDRVHAWRVSERHLPACLWFSAVTIAFHVFFASWMISKLIPMGGLMATLMMAMLFFWIGEKRDRLDVVPAMMIFLLSTVLIGLTIVKGDLPNIVHPNALHPSAMWIAPVCMLGFAFCPYLDLTFHRGFQESANPRVSFAVGFGGPFLLMIFFTLLYSGAMALIMTADGGGVGSKLLLVTLGLHLSVQAGFTIALHARPIVHHVDRIGPATLGIALVVGGLLLLRSTFVDPAIYGISMDRGEWVYRLFMSFYGLVFPAYAVICMKPWRREVPVAGRAHLLLFAVVVSVASPFYWLGFIAGRPWALVAGVAVVLAGWAASGTLSSRSGKAPKSL